MYILSASGVLCTLSQSSLDIFFSVQDNYPILTQKTRWLESTTHPGQLHTTWVFQYLLLSMLDYFRVQVEFTELNIDIKKCLRIKSSLSIQILLECQRVQKPLLDRMENTKWETSLNKTKPEKNYQADTFRIQAENKVTDQKALAPSTYQSPCRDPSILHERSPPLTNQQNFKDRGKKEWILKQSVWNQLCFTIRAPPGLLCREAGSHEQGSPGSALRVNHYMLLKVMQNRE